jgi:lambda family phage tail tape measure protein
MATSVTNIRVKLLNETKQGFRDINSNLRGLQTSTAGLVAKFAAVGTAIAGAFGVREIIRVGSEVENLSLRLQFLFGDVKEGSKAFKQMIDFAGQVPFSLRDIQAAAGNLAVVSKTADELTKNLKITANVAAVTGLDFKTAGEQLQRSFAGGIAASDLFRERGVRGMIGFQQGSKVSIAETVKAFEQAFGPGGKFGEAAEALATTYDGVLSMIGDKIFKFNQTIGDEGGLFDFAKGIVTQINNIIESNSVAIGEFAVTAGKKVQELVKSVVMGVANLLDTVMPVFRIVGQGIGGLYNLIQSLPAGIKELGLIGFFLLGGKAKLLLLVVGGLFDTIREGLGFLVQGFGLAQEGIFKLLEAVGVVSEKAAANFRSNMEKNYELAERLKTPLKLLREEQEGTAEATGDISKAMQEFFDNVDANIAGFAKQREELEKTLKATQDNQQPTVFGMNEEILSVTKKHSETVEKMLRRNLEHNQQINASFKERLSAENELNTVLELRQAIQSRTKLFGGLESDQVESLNLALTDSLLTYREFQAEGVGLAEAFDKAFLKAAQANGVTQDTLNKVADSTRSFRKEIAMSNEQLNLQQIELAENSRSFSYGWKKAMADYVDAATNAARQAERVFQTTFRGLEDLIVNFTKTGKFEFKQFVASIAEEMMRSNLRKLFAGIFGGGSTGGGGSMFAGFFANGGTIPGGQFGVVGERGPELVSGPATVTPLAQGGGSVTYNINAVDAASFKQLVARDPEYMFAITEQGRKSLPRNRR